MKDFHEIVALILKEDRSYHKGAYYFVREGIDFIIKTQKKSQQADPTSHHVITIADLLYGLRDYALHQYGPMAKTLFDTWKIHSCKDFGNIISKFIDFGILNRTNEDSIDDFINKGYDFHETFVKPFLPSKAYGH